MKKILINSLFIIGLLLIGIGTYSCFESYDKYLSDKNTLLDFFFFFFFESRTLEVKKIDDEKLSISIDDKEYDFVKEEDIYKSTDNSFIVRFDQDNLIFKMVSQEESVIFTKIKD